MTSGIRVRRRGPQDHAQGASEHVASATATHLICLGDAMLDPEQADPPLDLVDRLRTELAASGSFGPPRTTPAERQAIEDAVLPDGRRRHLVRGVQIRWAETAADLADVAWSDRFGEAASYLEIEGALVQCARLKLRPHGKVTGPLKYNHAAGRITSRPVTVDYIAGKAPLSLDARVGPEWSRFCEASLTLCSNVRKVVDLAIRCGRVLRVDVVGTAAQLCEPSDGLARKRVPDRRVFYLPTRCLPASLFTESGPGDATRIPASAREDKARRALCRQIEHARFAGRRIARSQAIAWLTDRFKVSRPAATGIWELCRPGDWKKVGRVPTNESFQLPEPTE